MQDNKRISDAEWVVMEELWDSAPSTAAEVVRNLQRSHDWKDQTIRTMLQRLIKKGVVQMRQRGLAYYYEPLVAREEIVGQESSSFLERFFGGSCKPLLLHFVRQGKLNPEEMSELKKALDDFSKEE